MTRLLFIGKVWPEPASSAAGARAMQLLEMFLASKCEVWFGTAAAETVYSLDLAASGIKVFPVALNSGVFDREITALQPDVVIFDRFSTEEQFGWRVAACCPDALRILDTEDLHCLREARQLAQADGREMSDDDLLNPVSKREIASIYRCDLSLIISTFEMKILEEFFAVNPDLLLHLPFLFDQIGDEQSGRWLPFHSRQAFISMGNFLHRPNHEAAKYLKTNIWPLIRKKLPAAELHLYGAYADTAILQMHKPSEGFIVKGRAVSSSEVMGAARICIAPLLTGAGLKGKLAEAMFCGTPSVTTPVGAEGMGTADDWPGAVADTPDDFAQAAILLYSSEQGWRRAQQKCSTCFNALFDRPRYGKALLDKMAEISGRLSRHRQKNFTGAMLMHHQHQSVRWLAKYIEAKNELAVIKKEINGNDEEKTNRTV